jgi:hypothetical protein
MAKEYQQLGADGLEKLERPGALSVEGLELFFGSLEGRSATADRICWICWRNPPVCHPIFEVYESKATSKGSLIPGSELMGSFYRCFRGLGT